MIISVAGKLETSQMSEILIILQQCHPKKNDQFRAVTVFVLNITEGDFRKSYSKV